MRPLTVKQKAVISCLLISLSGAAWFSMYGRSIFFNDSVFNSTAWKSTLNAEVTNQPIRQKMVDDLLSRYRLVGMKKKEIDHLLGKPPATGYFKDFDYVYWLGPERSFISIDSEWLCIKFKNNVASEATLMSD